MRRPGKSALLVDLGVSHIMASAAQEAADSQPRRILFFLCMAAHAAGGEIALTRAEMEAFDPVGRFELLSGPGGSLIARWTPTHGADSPVEDVPAPEDHHTAHRAAFERETT